VSGLAVIKQDLEKVVNYYKTNNLEINFKIRFNGHKNEEIDELMISNEIKKVESLKYLGVSIDNRLKMRDYADKLIDKLARSIYVLNVIKPYLYVQQKLQFYHAYVGSNLLYY
jgi:hypothetical protein